VEDPIAVSIFLESLFEVLSLEAIIVTDGTRAVDESA
jgi:hypothetical protein